MTPEKKLQLTTQLANHGLTVLLTRDYDTILLQLARLVQFERLMILESAVSPHVGAVLDQIRAEQQLFTTGEPEQLRPMDLLDVPALLAEVNRMLHHQLEQGAALRSEYLPAALAAFTGLLCKPSLQEAHNEPRQI